MSKRYNLEITKEGRKSSLFNVSEETLVGAIKDWAIPAANIVNGVLFCNWSKSAVWEVIPLKTYNLTEIKITFMGEEL